MNSQRVAAFTAGVLGAAAMTAASRVSGTGCVGAACRASMDGSPRPPRSRA